MFALLFDLNGLKFENVYVYSKSLYQLKYRLLETALKNVKGLKYFSYRENEEIVSPSKALPNSIFIFDDVSLSNQKIIQEYYSMGRHSAVDCFYLTQSYSKVPKQLIRDNVNLIILFKQDTTNLKHVYNNHVESDMTFEQFRSMCFYCWSKKYGFIIIDKDRDIKEGRYKCKFDYIFVNN